MTKNPSAPLQGSKSPWLPFEKANEFIDHSTSTPPLCLDANTPKLNVLKNPLHNEENYINLLHSDELLHSNTENIKIKEQLKSKQSEPSEQLQLSLAKQLTDIWNSKHQVYLEDKYNTTKNVSNKIYISRDKSLNIDQNKKENNTHSWPKGTYLIAGDSMVEGIDKRIMSSKRVIKVRKFPKASISNMYYYLTPLLEKKPDHLILHVGTNDVVKYEGKEIVDKLLQLKSFIQEKLPTTNVILSKPIMRADTKQREKVVTDVDDKLGELNIDIIDNGNLHGNHLNGKILHLNGKGILLYAKNLIEGIWKL